MSDRFLITDNRNNKNSVYMDDMGVSYLFVDREELENFLDIAPAGLDYIDLSPGFHSMEDIVSLCYKRGAKRLAIKSSPKAIGDSNEYEEVELEDIENDVGTTIIKLDKSILPTYVHYNNKLNSYLYFYLTTKDKKYLKQMRDSKFIIPCKINNSDTMVSIEYLTVLGKRENTFAYVLFTDLIEYKFWMAKHKEEIKDIKGLKPLELSVKELLRVNKNNGFYLNPRSDDVYIPGQEFNNLYKEKKKG